MTFDCVDELDHSEAVSIEAMTACSTELRHALWHHHAPIMRALRAPPPPLVMEKLAPVSPSDRSLVVPSEATGKRIIRMTAEAFGISIADMTSPSRKRPFVLARIVAARLLRNETWEDGRTRFSLPQIAKMLGRHDHSTIHYSLEMFGPYRRQNPEMKARYNLLRRKV